MYPGTLTSGLQSKADTGSTPGYASGATQNNGKQAMKDIEIILWGGSFFSSAIVSFFSGSLSWGIFSPTLSFILYCLMNAIYTTGGRDEGIGLVIAFSVVLIVTEAVPIGLFSVFGALLGETLSKRLKTK
ncbi:hypothetical protein [Desulfobulbus sp.]|uniref:hypothetical protein n=1 Tax=Desulfobulbus sp. TaxID=895 RepID=UPI0027BAADCD|nr:hypothetical protein [Desulfobulbus sp.]